MVGTSFDLERSLAHFGEIVKGRVEEGPGTWLEAPVSGVVVSPVCRFFVSGFGEGRVRGVTQRMSFRIKGLAISCQIAYIREF